MGGGLEVRNEANRLTARDEALAIALAFAEEEAAGVSPSRPELRAGGLLMRAPDFLTTVEDIQVNERHGEGEKCIACEDAVVNCCLIPCATSFCASRARAG